MNVLVIGNGGREHAIAWKVSQSTKVDRLFVAPGNSGTALVPKTENVNIAVDNLSALRAFALDAQIDLTIVGPEGPLVAGIVDDFHAAGLRIFGPSRQAAQLEGSKAFSKQFMQQHGIPTARAASFTDYEEAVDYLHTLSEPPVIKASGLAAGKGVILPNTHDEAVATLRSILLEGRFGAAGATVLLEERLYGPELSVLAFADGKTLRVMPAAQDHKRLLDGDLGPNTGGMGAFAPAPLATPALLAQIEREVLAPTLAGMQAAGTPYVGVIYAGILVTAQGPQVLEFNCRFGDPETQVLLPLLASDLVEIIEACLAGTLDQVTPSWHAQAAVSVVMAAGGYPDQPLTGQTIQGITQAEALSCQVFQAGAQLQGGQIVTAGGRVLNVTGLGRDLNAAADQAYRGVAQISFQGAQFRRDIGRVLSQSQAEVAA